MKDIKIFNSLTTKIEDFNPYSIELVAMYCCGITAYDHTHIGHIRKYLGDDLIKRTIKFNGYNIKHVQNVTDVGHLESDADEGEDKLEKGAKKHNLTVLEVARKFELEFYTVMSEMNITTPDIIERAASDDAISKQIEIIADLIEKDYAYVTDTAIYFDTSKLKEYNPFSKQSADEKLQNARGDVVVDTNKRNKADFVLWVFKKGDHANHALEWNTPWGKGFPGWHIECSAIGIKNLGEHIDIHTGGIDHKEVHHPNEIAQNEGYLGHSAVKYWVHHNFLTVDGEKMSKSKNNFYTLQTIIEWGYTPMALKYFMYTAHYRKQLNFTQEGLNGASIAYERLLQKVANFDASADITQSNIDKYIQEFASVINDDFNMPDALAVLWNTLNADDLNDTEKLMLISKYDEVFGLNILENSNKYCNNELDCDVLPVDVQNLIEQRKQARLNKDYDLSDKLRAELNALGYNIEDRADRVVVSKIN